MVLSALVVEIEEIEEIVGILARKSGEVRRVRPQTAGIRTHTRTRTCGIGLAIMTEIRGAIGVT